MHGLINEIIIALENKQYCTALFMDIEKAFDKINHESLLQTIRKQFPEQIHQLIKSYLSSRIFIIKIKDTYSEVKDIKVGIPQGSVLGPILLWRHSTSPNTTTRHYLVSDDGSEVVNVLGCERSEPGSPFGKKKEKSSVSRRRHLQPLVTITPDEAQLHNYHARPIYTTITHGHLTIHIIHG